ncbi:hypothetical protein TrRE_jg10928 [Triparma retinervis]|uniref:Uncharacterized protein n=1 Tax=Triparma retinervis TaxID=2557542 RepID=A0A9W7DN75_9STRA|nr:hypothetical protein TrRE_jg10928 [Triparma retinervis]
MESQESQAVLLSGIGKFAKLTQINHQINHQINQPCLSSKPSSSGTREVLTLVAATAFITYRLSGSPLDVSMEEKQCEREELWAAHNERFKPRKVRG